VPGFEISSIVDSPAAEVSAGVLSMAGVNAELMPWVRMTAPAAWKDRGIDGLPTGRRLFRSVILLFGVLPIDWHHFLLETVDRHGFRERSTSLMNAHWHHDRTLEDLGDGRTRITDRLDYRSRLPGVGWLLRPVYLGIFRHRHRRLRARFGG
jgi:ligand-binding SRPBCC domain-containing protein